MFENSIISVQILTSNHWCAISRRAIDKNIEFYTHSLKEEKKCRIVIRDLHHSIPENTIKSFVHRTAPPTCGMTLFPVTNAGRFTRWKASGSCKP